MNLWIEDSRWHVNQRRGGRRIKPYGWLADAQTERGRAGATDEPKKSVGPLTPANINAAQYISVEWPAAEGAPPSAPAICLSLKILRETLNISPQRKARFDYVPTEDSIHPVAMSFDPPLVELGNPDARGFNLYWEKLTYVFDLPDPAAFRRVRVAKDDRKLLERFVQLSRRMAKFALINNNTVLSVDKKASTGWRVRIVAPPSDESFLGASAAFRQLHNDGESASLVKCYNALFKVIAALPPEDSAATRDTLVRWRSARGKLMNQTLQTLTTMKATNATLDNPISFKNIKPDELIRKFNYGDSLHFDVEGDLVDLLADPHHKAYYTYGATISILGLSHLYFGFAVLLERALQRS